MSILTYPTTPKPFTESEFNREWMDVHSPIFGGGTVYTNSLLRHDLRTWLFPYRNTRTNRNTMMSFVASARRQGNRFWCFWPEAITHYDQYVDQVGPWPLTGCMVYDASEVTYTDETDDANNATASDVSVHPAAGVNDEIIILAKRKFDTATFTIATPGVGDYVISGWKYSKNDGTWAALTVTDNTTNFKAAAGARTVTFTMPTDWDTVTVNGAEGYATKAIFDGASVTTPPLVTLITVTSLTFDLPGSSCSSVTVYKNGTALTAGGTDYTLVSGGGGGGSDRITLATAATQGDLLTADFTGNARILGYFSENALNERFIGSNFHIFAVTVKEDRR